MWISDDKLGAISPVYCLNAHVRFLFVVIGILNRHGCINVSCLKRIHKLINKFSYMENHKFKGEKKNANC